MVLVGPGALGFHCGGGIVADEVMGGEGESDLEAAKVVPHVEPEGHEVVPIAGLGFAVAGGGVHPLPPQHFGEDRAHEGGVHEVLDQRGTSGAGATHQGGDKGFTVGPG